MNNNNDLAVRSSGDPLFTVSLDGEITEVFDWTHWSQEQGLGKEEQNALLEELLVKGAASLAGADIELLDGQGLTQQIAS